MKMSCGYFFFFVFFIFTTSVKGQDATLHAHFILFTQQNGRMEVTSNSLSMIDLQKPSVFLIHGYYADISRDVYLLNVTDAYRDLNDRNVIFVNWGPYSYGNYVELVYSGVQRLGRMVGQLLLELNQNGADLKRMHLIGQSLGAHIAGAAGRYVQENHPQGERIHRISAFDAAGPLYWKVFFVLDNPFSLRKTDADIVDCTHSNGGVFGTAETIGTVDFLLNGGSAQKYCDMPYEFLQVVSENVCNHVFGSVFYHLTIGSMEYKASRSPTSCEDVIVYGDLFDGNATGVYYVSTEDNFPFKTRC